MLRLCASEPVCTGDPEFTKYMIARNHNDILSVAWWCYVCMCNCVHSMQLNHGSKGIDCYGATMWILCSWYGEDFLIDVDSIIKVGRKLGLWERDDTLRVFESYDCDYAFGYWYNRSNEFVERAASQAFLYMRPFCGKDVAGLIARMVARMYLEDYKWLQNEIPISDNPVQLLQERIMKYAPN